MSKVLMSVRYTSAAAIGRRMICTITNLPKNWLNTNLEIFNPIGGERGC